MEITSSKEEAPRSPKNIFISNLERQSHPNQIPRSYKMSQRKFCPVSSLDLGLAAHSLIVPGTKENAARSRATNSDKL